VISIVRKTHVIVIAGPNGAGKSTTAPAILKGALDVTEFVNADTIAQGLSAFNPERAAFHAGRIMLTRLRQLARVGEKFAFEITLASKTFAPWLKSLKDSGYAFIWSTYGFHPPNLPSPGLPNGYAWEGTMSQRKQYVVVIMPV
jgi:predicted ABC-type ATPase